MKPKCRSQKVWMSYDPSTPCTHFPTFESRFAHIWNSTSSPLQINTIKSSDYVQASEVFDTGSTSQQCIFREREMSQILLKRGRRYDIMLCFIQGGRSCAGARGAPPKSFDSDENFKPEHTLFCPELRFVAIYALFGDLWAKKVPFWVKNSVSLARSALLHGIYCIFHRVNFANLRLRAKTTHLTRKL